MGSGNDLSFCDKVEIWVIQSPKSEKLVPNDSFGPLLSSYDPLDLINGCNAVLSSIGALDRVVTPTRMVVLGDTV